MIMLFALVVMTGCDWLGPGDSPGPGNNNGTDNPSGGGEVQQPEEPLFPPGSETVEGVKQPKGAVKTFDETLYYAGQMTMFFERTYIYDELGRPARVDVISHSYDNSGNEVGSPTRRSDNFFYLDDGTDHSSDIEYTDTYYRSAITNPTGTAPHENVPWTYTWNNDGDLHCAYESWPVGKEPDPDDIRTEYYFYTSDANPTLGAVFDITAQIVQGLEGFYFYGRGTAHLPSYVNTAYRNKAKTFSYKWSADKKSITEITIERWPFANDHDFSSLKYTHIWRFTYYQ